MKPLDGLRVLDLTTIVSGPYAAVLLADMGADVIKIEPPSGDAARVFESTEPLYTLDGMSPHLLTLSRNKRGMVINLREPDGLDAFYDLVRWADIVVDNYRPGVTDRLKIDYESLKAVNPRIIACSITGYGLTGPGRDRAALDACIQAYAGVMGMTGEPDGVPMRAGPLYSDLCSGMAGALGILSAVVARGRTGVGQQVDISMLDVQLSMLSYNATMHLMSGLPAGRYGNEHALHVPYNAYRTADSFLFVAIVINAHWPAFVQAIRASGYDASLEPDVAFLSDSRLEDRVARLKEREAINDSIARVLADRPRAAWIADFQAAGIPFAPVNSVEDALADPQARAREMVVEVGRPGGGTPGSTGTFEAPGNPIKLSDAGPSTYSPPPQLGQDTVAVLRDVLGYDQPRIDALLASGAVAQE